MRRRKIDDGSKVETQEKPSEIAMAEQKAYEKNSDSIERTHSHKKLPSHFAVEGRQNDPNV